MLLPLKLVCYVLHLSFGKLSPRQPEKVMKTKKGDEADRINMVAAIKSGTRLG